MIETMAANIIASNKEEAITILTLPTWSEIQKEEASSLLQGLMMSIGNVVTRYPLWHPLVRSSDLSKPSIVPDVNCGFYGISDAVFFAHGFITWFTPGSEREEEFTNAVDRLINERAAFAKTHPLRSQHRYGAPLEHTNLPRGIFRDDMSVHLVRCDWGHKADEFCNVTHQTVRDLVNDEELLRWTKAHHHEEWSSARPLFLGVEEGDEKSPFVTHSTALVIERIWYSVKMPIIEQAHSK